MLASTSAGPESLQFDVMLHVATVLSTIVILWREFWPLVVSFFTFRRDDRFWYVCKILISCIPIGIVGVFFKDTIETFFGQELTLVGTCLCVTAALLASHIFSAHVRLKMPSSHLATIAKPIHL